MGGRGSGDPNGKPENLTNAGRGTLKKGQSANPSGRAHLPRTLVTMAIRERLQQWDPKRQMYWAQVIAQLLFNCATDPDPELDKTRLMALDQIIDRSEGKPKQQVEVADITAELRQRSDEDLQFYMVHDYWPEDEYMQQRNKKLIEANAKFAAVKTDSDTTQ